MQSLLLEDSFEDIFRECDPDWAGLTTEEESCCGAVEDTAEKTRMSSQPGPSNTGSKKRTHSQLNKKEREQVIARLRSVSGWCPPSRPSCETDTSRTSHAALSRKSRITCLSSGFM